MLRQLYRKELNKSEYTNHEGMPYAVVELFAPYPTKSFVQILSRVIFENDGMEYTYGGSPKVTCHLEKPITAKTAQQSAKQLIADAIDARLSEITDIAHDCVRALIDYRETLN